MMIFTDVMVIRESCNIVLIDGFQSALGWKIQRLGNNLPSYLINIGSPHNKVNVRKIVTHANIQ